MDRKNEAVYRALADHLNGLPDGFPPSSTGAELRVLERLFSVDEAQLAVHLTLERETARQIAERAGMPHEIVAERLSEMATKGLVLSVERDEGETLYQAIPFVVGIFEFQVNDLTPEFLMDLGEYAQTRGTFPRVRSIPQLRTVPVGVSLSAKNEALPYEKAEELVNAHDRFAVTNCLCRTITRMAGTACDAPLETCLYFGDWADYFIKTGRGRALEREEVLEKLREANEANLVLQPSNTKEAAVICCCCGCCCGVLGPLKQLQNPSAEVSSSFRAEYDAGACIGCHACISRCQMDAIAERGKKIEVRLEHCIGCGLCVATCPSGALQLVRRDDADPETVPENMDAMWAVMKHALDVADDEGRKAS